MKKLDISIILVVIICLFSGCMKPPKLELIETIKTNETAFLVPLEGDSKEGQQKFMSVEYLEQAKVATKRITLPQRELKIGRWGHNIKWIPTMKIIKVNRMPITREWTQEDNKGTNNTNESIEVESKDSIGFSIGVNLTTLIKEEDAAKFLSFYSGKSLAEITDQNVRGYISSVLSREFGTRDLKRCKAEKKEIQEIVKTETVEEFNNYGVTLTNIGLVGGLMYDEPEIQKSINDAYIAEMSILAKENGMKAQKHENDRVLSIAVTERKSAQEFEKAYQAMIKKIELDIEMKKAEALLVAAGKWSGNTPTSILPQGSNLLFGLDK